MFKRITDWISLTIFFTVVCLIVTGCWDRRELNQNAFVLSTGISEHGKDNYEITQVIAIPSRPTEEKKASEQILLETQIGDRNLAIDRIEARLSRKMNFHHRRLIVISENLAKNKLMEVISPELRMIENRLNTFIVIAKGNVKELLSTVPKLETFPGEMIRGILHTAMVKPVNEQDLMNRIELDGIDPALPVFELKKRRIQLVGIALLSKDKMVSFIPKQKMNPYLWLNQHFTFRTHREELQVDGKKVIIKLTGGRTRLELEESSKNRLQYRFIVKATGEIMDNPTKYDLAQQKNIRRFEQIWQDQLTRSLEKAVMQLKDKRCDLLGAGMKLHAKYPGLWKKIQDWHQEFAKSEISVRVSTSIQEVGSLNYNLNQKR